MANNEAIVDTCFIEKLSSEGGKVENIKLVLDELGYSPVVHPYIAEHELSLYSYSDNLIKSGYIRKVEYGEFLKDDYDRTLYESYFKTIYEDMRMYLESAGGLKQIKKLNFAHGSNIYNCHNQGSSMGDVHMILMATFLRLPIILTEDSDIAILRTIVKKRVQLDGYALDIYNGVDLIKKIAEKDDSKLSKKDLEAILLCMGEKKHRSEMKAVWNKNHPD